MSDSGGAEPAHADERLLVAQAQGGSQDAFETLVRRHQRQVYAVALRMLGDTEEARDIAQETFLRAYRGLSGFRAEAKFSTWLTSIALRLCLNRRRWWARRRKIFVSSAEASREPAEPVDASETVADPAPNPHEAAARREQQATLARALQQLDAGHRSVIVLRDIHGYSYEEIAQILGCRLGTVRSRLSRARLHLKQVVEANG